MASEGFRRSDRIYLELPIQILGTDGTGRGFMEQAQTLVLSRHGAKILFARRLVPQQEVTIHCLSTGKEAVARVIGEIGEWPEGFLYGIAFLDPQSNPWDISFVQIEESPRPAGRTVMECLHCHTSEVVHLDEFDVEVLEANERLSRGCKRCRDTTLWKRSSVKPPAEHPTPPGAKAAEPAADTDVPPKRTRNRNDRKQVRLNMKVRACIHSRQFGDDLVLPKTFRAVVCASRARSATRRVASLRFRFLTRRVESTFLRQRESSMSRNSLRKGRSSTGRSTFGSLSVGPRLEAAGPQTRASPARSPVCGLVFLRDDAGMAAKGSHREGGRRL
jgi:hypothetical protein